jgi:uncharacterized protein YndB with AHSA1/START domain
MSNATIAPVRRTVFVEAPPERAFAVFTAGFASWWPKSHSVLEVEQEAAIIEPEVGGRWYERGAGGEECDWGRVLAYEPPHRLLLSWLLDGEFEPDPDESKAGEVEVTFAPEGTGTRVELEHRGFERRADGGAQVAESVAGEGGWSGLLVAYAEAAAQASS